MDHIKACAKEWRWTATEVLDSAQMYAGLDEYQLGRLPELMAAKLAEKAAKKRNPAGDTAGPLTKP